MDLHCLKSKGLTSSSTLPLGMLSTHLFCHSFPDLTQHLSKAAKIALHTEALDKHRTAPPSMHLPLGPNHSGHFMGAKLCHPIPMALNPSQHAVLLLREKSEKSVCVPCIFATSHPGLASKDEHGPRAAHVTCVIGVEAAWGPSPSSSQ